MNIFVTGGAGYIGAAAARALLKAGHQVTVYDSLITGHKAAVPRQARFINSDLGDHQALEAALQSEKYQAVMHFAAFIEAGESMKDPLKFYRNNLFNSIDLIDTAVRSGVERFVLSSTAAVYQSSDQPLSEESPLDPVNVYGHTKLMIEESLEFYREIFGLHFAALRYFNAAGALSEHGEAHQHTSAKADQDIIDKPLTGKSNVIHALLMAAPPGSAVGESDSQPQRDRQVEGGQDFGMAPFPEREQVDDQGSHDKGDCQQGVLRRSQLPFQAEVEGKKRQDKEAEIPDVERGIRLRSVNRDAEKLGQLDGNGCSDSQACRHGGICQGSRGDKALFCSGNELLPEPLRVFRGKFPGNGIYLAQALDRYQKSFVIIKA